jgi:hypothetical protein
VVASTQSSFERIESQYNADTEELSVKITARSPVIGVTMALDQREIALKYDFQPTKTYTGVNGYGARVTVEKHFTSIYSVLFENFNSYASELPDRYSSSGTIITRLKLVPSAARAAKESLRALLFVRLRNPAVEKGYISKKPTVQDPHETFAVYYYLVADVEQLWLYNYESGQVYKVLIPRHSR